MTIFVITDSHFGHERIKKYCGRPNGYEWKILNNLRGIKPHDVLVHLGDICFGDDHGWLKKLNLATSCRKWLVKGNHDKKSYTWYLSHGFDFVCESFELKIHGKKVVISHRPLPDGDYDVNVHGHCHVNPDKRYIDDKHILVKSEHLYHPQDLRKLLNA